MGKLGNRLIALAAMTVAVAAFSPAGAGAAERVLDGSFDTITSCEPADCSSLVWSEAGTGSGAMGPLCQVGTASCGYFAGLTMGPRSGLTWAQLGGETVNAGLHTYAIEQVVNLPATPATLSFHLRTGDSNVSNGAFTASIGGTPVFAAGGSTPGYDDYAPVSVEVGAFGGGLRILRFEAVNNQGSSGSSDSFNVDDVSLDDRPAPPAPVQTATGLREAALKKCKKKKSKKKRKKCRKKAKKLPV